MKPHAALAERLAETRRFDQLIALLRDELDWPIGSADFEDLTFEYDAEELGIDKRNAAKIEEIKRLRPLVPNQPWGIFFVKFEPKRLPVVALRRILSAVAVKKRASANSAERAAWAPDDLLFVSNYGEGEERHINFAHFARSEDGQDLPTLKVLGWDNRDTALHLDAVARELQEHLVWPQADCDVDTWRTSWRAAFTLGHREVVTTSKELSIRLASLARAIRDRIQTVIAIENDKGPLTRLMKAFQEALIHDLGAEGFADMYAQTIAYGLLSSRIADPNKKTADDFAAHMRTNPLLRDLMETFLKAGGRQGKAGGPGIDFDELGVSEIVGLLDTANMGAVVRDFGDRNPQEDPVIHFYELFLKEYDAKKRMQRGVFYTPRPVVAHIVRALDELLRTEFGLADGLADTTTWGEMAARHGNLEMPEGVSPDQDFVQILDPATGTGTFLVEVIASIHDTLSAKWLDEGLGEDTCNARWNDYVSRHLLTRLHGYELLMAPYTIAHLKIGLKLAETGYVFGSEERARVFLTNALEQRASDTAQLAGLAPAVAYEVAAVDRVKALSRFTVILGNPPYSTVSRNMSDHARALVAEYMQDRDGPIVERSNRNHLQDDYVKFVRLAELSLAASGCGMMGLITNASFLSGDWHRGMRYQLLNRFNQIKVVDLHGGAREDLAGDKNIFDIRQNVAITVAVLLDKNADDQAVVQYSELRGPRDSKFRQLAGPQRLEQRRLKPTFDSQWAFVPRDDPLDPSWTSSPPITDMFEVWGYGAKTNRDGLAVAFSQAELLAKMHDFIDPKNSDQDLEGLYGFSPNYQWLTAAARNRLRREGLDPALILPYLYRPFDLRFIYWHPAVVFNMRGPKLSVFREKAQTPALLFSRASRQEVSSNFLATRWITDCSCIEGCNVAALYRPSLGGDESGQLPLTGGTRETNLRIPDESKTDPHTWFRYMYGLLHSTAYRSAFAPMLRRDWPRILQPKSEVLLRDLAGLGASLLELHLEFDGAEPDTSVVVDNEGATSSPIGRVSWTEDSGGSVWLSTEKGGCGQPPALKGVSSEVWRFRIGGYQVCEKWLKDRKGRQLTPEDVTHYLRIVSTVKKTQTLMRAVDEVIEAAGFWHAFLQRG